MLLHLSKYRHLLIQSISMPIYFQLVPLILVIDFSVQGVICHWQLFLFCLNVPFFQKFSFYLFPDWFQYLLSEIYYFSYSFLSYSLHWFRLFVALISYCLCHQFRLSCSANFVFLVLLIFWTIVACFFLLSVEKSYQSWDILGITPSHLRQSPIWYLLDLEFCSSVPILYIQEYIVLTTILFYW